VAVATVVEVFVDVEVGGTDVKVNVGVAVSGCVGSGVCVAVCV
jgi:hypothetical protein